MHVNRLNNKHILSYVAGYGKRSGSICLLLVYILSIFAVGGASRLVVSAIIVGLLMILVFKKEFLFALPCMVFFYSELVFIGGISVFRVYTLLYFMRAIVLHIRFDKSQLLAMLAPYAYIVLYTLMVVMPNDLRLALFICLDFTFIYLYAAELKSAGYLGLFFDFIAFAGVSASIFGLISPASSVVGQNFDGQYVIVQRYLATFEDVNYAGFFFNLAIISTITSQTLIRDIKAKIPVLAILYLALIRTGSTTAYIVNVLLILLFLLVRYKSRIVKPFFIMCALLAMFIALFQIGLRNPDIDFLHAIALRLNDKISALLAGDMDTFTTLRSSLSSKHFDYYVRQDSIFKLLLGGNAVSGQYLNTSTFSEMAHNEYIDLLLNVGMLGFAVLVGKQCFVVAQLLGAAKCEGSSLALLLSKISFLLYGCTLTMFLNPRFYLFFFL